MRRVVKVYTAPIVWTWPDSGPYTLRSRRMRHAAWRDRTAISDPGNRDELALDHAGFGTGLRLGQAPCADLLETI